MFHIGVQTPHFIKVYIYIYIKKKTKQKKYQTKRHPNRTSLFSPNNIKPTTTDNSSSIKVLSNFISKHSQSLQNPITHRNHPRIRIPRASPDAPVEQKTIQGRGRPLDEPTESGKSRETDEKRLARILTTKESWNARQKKPPDSGGNLPVAFLQQKKTKKNKRKQNKK